MGRGRGRRRKIKILPSTSYFTTLLVDILQILLSTCCVPGSVLGPGDTGRAKLDKNPCS